MGARKLVLGMLLAAPVALADDPMWVDARLVTTAQYFKQGLLPGQPGAVARIEPAFPVTLSGFVRFGAVDMPGAPDALSGEVAAWGSVGPRDGQAGDGDVTSAWAQYQQKGFRLKIGRQVTLPGSSRYVRFDGASLQATAANFLDAEVYAGFVALPRWNMARGAQVLGFIGDALNNPLLTERQNREGEVTMGGRVTVRLPLEGRLAIGFHEQHDALAASFRVLSADASVRPANWLGLGGRFSFDLMRLAPSEARGWIDLNFLDRVPTAIDYVYQQPSLLLPQTSVLAAFGGAPWHEIGIETSVRALESFTVTGRAAAQFFEGAVPGGRGHLGFRWRPWLDGRFTVLAQGTRVVVAPSGYWQARVGGQMQLTETLTATLDGSLFFYDAPIHGVTTSGAGMLSLEWLARPWLRAMVSTTVMRTPWADFEMQGLARLVVQLDQKSAGGLP